MRARVWSWLVVACALSACAEEQGVRFAGGDAASDAGLDGGGCANDTQCDDRIACTVDHCRAGACAHTPCADCCPEGLSCVEGFGCGPARRPCATDAECSDGVRCTLDRCRDGRFCESTPQSGLCDGGRVCFAALGCIQPPPDRCERDGDCERDACGGRWTCQPELGCAFRALTDCDDRDACTADACDPARGGCQHTPRDGDGDAHGDARCGGDDCDDADRERHPGAAERCGNGVDDDCDGMTDEGCCAGDAPCATTCGSTGRTGCGDAGARCVPPAETCNGRDDDCDNAPDNGLGCVMGSREPCTSACGSAGARACNAGCAWGACVPSAEACNGRDDDCDGTTDEGCCAGGAACATSCGSAGRTSCGDAGVRCVPPTETCNGRDDDCDGARDNGFACVAGSTGGCTTACGSAGTRACLGDCAWDACAPPRESCNGADDNCNGACDDGFTCCARSTRECAALGFTRGTAVCRGDCSGWDTSACDSCGNRVRDGREQCDAADLGGQRCADLGFGGGTLRCASSCLFDTSMCTSCGNGRAEASEACDGTDLRGARCETLSMGFSGGTLRCTQGCAYDTSACVRAFNPTGTWSVSSAVQYRCALAFGVIYLVDINAATLAISDTGASLTATHASIPCAMTGPSARSSRTVSATCTARGTCNETYTLSGSFGSDSRFTGTLTMAFSGSDCRDCAMQSRGVTLTR